MNRQPGEVWLADLGLAAKTRPVIVVSRFALTTQNRISRYEVAIPRLPFLNQESFANVLGLASAPIVRLERRLGRLPSAMMTELKVALPFALDLD